MHDYNRPPIGNYICRVQWSRDRWCPVTPKGQGRDPISLGLQISITVQDRCMVTMDHQEETTYANSDGHVPMTSCDS